MEIFEKLMLGCIAALLLLIIVGGSIATCKKATLLNNEYGTNYSCSDIFWTEDMISNLIIGKKLNVNMGNKQYKTRGMQDAK